MKNDNYYKTARERAEVYEKALKYLLSRKDYIGMCAAVRWVADDSYPLVCVMSAFPELDRQLPLRVRIKYRKAYSHSSFFWWPTDAEHLPYRKHALIKARDLALKRARKEEARANKPK